MPIQNRPPSTWSISVRSQQWRFCRRGECPERDVSRAIRPWRSVGFSLDNCRSDSQAMQVLRRMLGEVGHVGFMISRLTDDLVIAEVSHLFESGQLQVCNCASSPNSTTAGARPLPEIPQRAVEETVLRALPSRATREFRFRESSYRLIHSLRWNQFRDQGRYQIVAQEEARRALEAMADEPLVPTAESTALRQAASLVRDMRSSRPESGILLLRITPVVSVPRADAPALTPSQLARARQRETETHWVAIELVDEQGVGIAGQDYVIVTPDNASHSGVTDSEGRAKVTGIIAGQCKINFPKLDKDAWRAA